MTNGNPTAFSPFRVSPPLGRTRQICSRRVRSNEWRKLGPIPPEKSVTSGVDMPVLEESIVDMPALGKSTQSTGCPVGVPATATITKTIITSTPTCAHLNATPTNEQMEAGGPEQMEAGGLRQMEAGEPEAEANEPEAEAEQMRRPVHAHSHCPRGIVLVTGPMGKVKFEHHGYPLCPAYPGGRHMGGK